MMNPMQAITDAPSLVPDYCTVDGETWCKACRFPCATCPVVRDATSPRRIIAFTGLAGSGKSTAALHLVNQGWTRVRFADRSKR